MAIDYTWDVKTVDVKEIDGKADTVFNVHWVLIGTDNDRLIEDELGNDKAVVERSSGTIALDTSDLSNFIPFSNLTASKVQGWVETALNKINKNEVQTQKDSIALAIENIINPPFQTKTLDK